MVKKIISNPLFIGAVGGLITNFLSDVAKKYGGISMEFLYKYFWTGVWPIWIGLIIAVTYWFIRFLFNFRRQYMHYKDFSIKTEDDWRKTHQNVLDAWQRISGHGNKIEVLEFKLNKLDENIKEHYKNHELNR